MKTTWIKKFSKTAREVKLTARDKRAMLNAILGPKNIPSPYGFFLTVMEYRTRIAVAAFTFMLIITSGGTSYAASAALPGDALYPIKTNINEGLQTLVAVTPDAKVKVEVQHTKNRLAEAEILSKKGKLTEETQAIIETKITEHTESIKAGIAELTSEQATTTVKEVIADLKSTLDEHAAVLSDLASSSSSATTTVEASSTLAVEARIATMAAPVEQTEQDKHIDALITKVNEVKSTIEDIEKAIDDSAQAQAQAQVTATSTAEVDNVIINTWTSSSSESQVISPNASSSQPSSTSTVEVGSPKIQGL